MIQFVCSPKDTEILGVTALRSLIFCGQILFADSTFYYHIFEALEDMEVVEGMHVRPIEGSCIGYENVGFPVRGELSDRMEFPISHIRYPTQVEMDSYLKGKAI